MRNPRRELNDIRFEYKPTTDSAQGIANELLATGLITNEDVEPMATNLKRLIENPPPTRVVTFTVSTGYVAAEGARDENNLSRGRGRGGRAPWPPRGRASRPWKDSREQWGPRSACR